jgi:hypothetical protein
VSGFPKSAFGLFVVLFGKVRFCRKRFGWLSLLIIWRFGKFCFQPLPKSKFCVKLGRVGGGSGFQSASLAQSLPTKRAVDLWDSAAFSVFFWLRVFSHLRSESRPAHKPLTQTVGRWVM